MTIQDCRPGQRVRVRQTIDRREGDWRCAIEGTVIGLEPQKTGSWFAHGKDNKLWLYRLQLRKENGEITTLTLDRYTEIDLVQGAAATP